MRIFIPIIFIVLLVGNVLGATSSVVRVRALIGGSEKTVDLNGWALTYDGTNWTATIDALDVGGEVITSTVLTNDAQKLRYVTRGDLGSWDFTKPDFTRDGTWTDLVLTNGEMTVDAKVLHVRMNLKRSFDAQQARFRKDGVTGGVNEHRPMMDGLNDSFPEWFMDIGTNCTIQYNFTTGTWDNIKFTVLGEYVP